MGGGIAQCPHVVLDRACPGQTKLPDYMGLNSARHARRAGHVRSHQLSLMSEMNIDAAAPTAREKTRDEARAMGIQGLDSVDKGAVNTGRGHGKRQSAESRVGSDGRARTVGRANKAFNSTAAGS